MNKYTFFRLLISLKEQNLGKVCVSRPRFGNGKERHGMGIKEKEEN